MNKENLAEKSVARTTCYIFFEKGAENYLIKGILNNHCEEAKFIGTNEPNK